MKNETYNQVNTDKIRELHRDLIINECNYLKGLKRLGKDHEDCPYNPYEHLVELAGRSAERIEKYSYTKLSHRNGIQRFRSFAYVYNEYVDDYNKFVSLAAGGYETFALHNKNTAYLLKNVKQPVYYKFIKPEIKETKELEVFEGEIDPEAISMDGFAINNLVLLLDVSSSMKAEEKLPLLKKSFWEILPYLRAEDEISIVVFSGKGKVLLNAVSCSKKEIIINVLESLESSEQTNFDTGFSLAYKTARKNFKANANNRIIVTTDETFSISDRTYQLARNEACNNVFLSVFHFGNDKSKVNTLEKLARKGGGNYENIINVNAKDKLLKEWQAFRID